MLGMVRPNELAFTTAARSPSGEESAKREKETLIEFHNLRLRKLQTYSLRFAKVGE